MEEDLEKALDLMEIDRKADVMREIWITVG
jgi:hypothetical protein